MSKPSKYQKIDIKKPKSKFQSNYIDEENLSFKEIKREKFDKQYRNYDNALRAKNLDRLLSYDEDG